MFEREKVSWRVGIRRWWKLIKEDAEWRKSGILGALMHRWYQYSWLEDCYWWIRYHTDLKYQTCYLHIKTLDQIYYDECERLLHAAFQCLVEFVEGEAGSIKRINWKSDKYHRKVYSEFNSLYRWWTKVYPNRKDLWDLPENEALWKRIQHKSEPCKRDEDGDPTWYEWKTEGTPEDLRAYRRIMTRQINLEKRWKEEEEKNLIRLMKIRLGLWT